jgi:hypothetical protein
MMSETINFYNPWLNLIMEMISQLPFMKKEKKSKRDQKVVKYSTFVMLRATGLGFSSNLGIV